MIIIYNIIIIKVKEKGGKIKKLNHLKIQITIYKSFNLMYNINIIKVKELTLKVLNKLNFWRSINMEKIKLNEEQIEEYIDVITNFQHILNDILNSVENSEIDEMQLSIIEDL